eukprot:CAMPEP_0179201566 /NCGR_PEP_ID=MMETSP0796-20121207/100320_1 /TAXON_ID=73915 /ORGANISM="Pyrodinium bahamense, Strain pbaha01" /LENGTH=95 /DNA_ID=CAMNT_0020906129 /DNA_START=176 /DNA_END=463 /DNA_ORIENTATION=-
MQHGIARLLMHNNECNKTLRSSLNLCTACSGRDIRCARRQAIGLIVQAHALQVEFRCEWTLRAALPLAKSNSWLKAFRVSLCTLAHQPHPLIEVE